MKIVYLVNFVLGLQICSTLIITTSSQWENVTIPSFQSASPTSCRQCTVNFNVFEFMWHTQVYTHLAKTVKLIVDNGTNLTETSTIQGPTFQLPSKFVADATVVSGSIYTVTVGSGIYTLTYPTSYFGVGYVQSIDYITTTNNASRVVCTASEKAFSDGFLQVPNGPRLSDYYSLFEKRNCSEELESPPRVLVQVSSLTATSTEYGTVPRQSKTPASPSILPASPTIEPTRSATEPLSKLSKTKPSSENSQGTISDVQSTSTKAAPPFKESLITSVPLPFVSSIVPTALSSALPFSSAEVSVFLSPHLLESIHPNLDPTTYTANTVSQFLVGGTSVSPNGLPISVSVATILFEPSHTNVVLNGNTIVLPSNKAASAPDFVLGSKTYPASSLFNLVLEGSTAVPSGSATTTFGTAIQNEPFSHDSAIDGNTFSHLDIGLSSASIAHANLAIVPGAYIFNGQSLNPGSSPITVSGTLISLAQSATALIVGSNTIPVKLISQSFPFTVVGKSTITANSISEYVAGNQRSISNTGGSTMSGDLVSHPTSASGLFISPITLPTILVTSQSLPFIVFEGSTITPDSASQYIVGSQTLSPGTSDITVSGVHVSLAPSESFAVVGTKTIVPITSSGLGAIIINGLRNPENGSVFTGSAGKRKATVGSGCLYGFAILGLTVILQCILN